MNCPYCNKSMKLGVIRKDRYHPKWVSEDNDQGILNFTPFVEGIKLVSKENEFKIKVFYCKGCRKFIIDQDNM